jgi:hypothetical protein
MGKSSTKVYGITEQQLESFAKMTADETVKAYTKELKNEAKRSHDRRLYNMRILLENYRSLNEYAQSAIYSVEQLSEEGYIEDTEVKMLMKCGLRGDDLLIKSVASGAVRVKTLMAQVNKMLDIYTGGIARHPPARPNRDSIGLSTGFTWARSERPRKRLPKQSVKKYGLYKTMQSRRETTSRPSFSV